MLNALVAVASDEGGFHAPSVSEFFPGELIFAGTPFAMTRLNLIGMVMTALIVVLFVLAFRKPKLVPRGIQNVGEWAIDMVYSNIIDEILGKKGAKYAPYLVSMFFLLFAFNITGIIPFANIAVTSVIGLPMLLAIVAWFVFNVEGIRKHGLGHYLKLNLFPPGVPPAMYVLVTPIEFISTFILRPITLTLRLLANMMAGHLLLVLFFSATSALLAGTLLQKFLAIPAYAMGFAFTLFEILVALLQAYIFTLLTAVYIDGAISEEH